MQNVEVRVKILFDSLDFDSLTADEVLVHFGQTVSITVVPSTILVVK